MLDAAAVSPATIRRMHGRAAQALRATSSGVRMQAAERGDVRLKASTIRVDGDRIDNMRARGAAVVTVLSDGASTKEKRRLDGRRCCRV